MTDSEVEKIEEAARRVVNLSMEFVFIGLTRLEKALKAEVEKMKEEEPKVVEKRDL